jgi:hypothetical protein
MLGLESKADVEAMGSSRGGSPKIDLIRSCVPDMGSFSGEVMVITS